MPKPMLGGRSARVILTSDTPRWFLAVMYRSPIVHQQRDHVLRFVGIKPTRFTYFAGASHAQAGKVDGWLSQAKALGARAA